MNFFEPCWRVSAFSHKTTQARVTELQQCNSVFCASVDKAIVLLPTHRKGTHDKRVSDEFTVPLCRGHHREIHRCGDEAAWWARTGIDPTAAARALWLKTHPLPRMIGQPGFKLPKEANLDTRSP